MSNRDTVTECCFDNTGFNEKQRVAMNKLVERKKKDAKIQAKEEEKNWVEFRKLEVLYNFRPTSAGYAKSMSDDSFPKRRKGVNMGFGERKAYYLSIRPDPRFAVWFGKKKAEKKAGKKIPPSEKVIAKPAAVQAAKSSQIESVSNREEEDDGQLVFLGRKGKKSSNPLNDKGIPFWMLAEQEEELDDEDYIVSAEALEKVAKNEIPLTPMPGTKTTFDPFMDVKLMMKEDKIFDRKITFSNTVRVVINLSGENKAEMPAEQDRKVEWEKNMKFSNYSMTIDRKQWTNVEKPLKDIVKLSDK